MTSDEDLAARFGDRYDAQMADAMLAMANQRTTGVPDFLGMRFTGIGPGWSVCEVELRPELLNPAGVAHGSVVASLVDHVLGCTVIAHVPAGTWPATLEFKLNYLAPAREGMLAARGELRSLSSRTAVVSVECTNAGRPVATALGTVMITPPKPG
jgi:1,4-dihydroxy-2-naphthoyl-CoA hydrolase